MRDQPLPRKAGKLNLLCINHSARRGIPGYADPDRKRLPQFRYAAGTRFGRRTPPEIVEKFYDKLVEIGKSDQMKATMRQVSALTPYQSRDEIKKFLVDDMTNNAELIKVANVKLE